MAGTFEFLVSGSKVAFLEANARIQVEHTVTEEACGVDLVHRALDVDSIQVEKHSSQEAHGLKLLFFFGFFCGRNKQGARPRPTDI